MPDRVYTVAGPGKYQPPAYDRVAASLSSTDLEEELRLGKGGVGWLAAVRGEIERRKRES